MITRFAQSLGQEFTGYSIETFFRDMLAGLTVAAVALPLALAFGVGSGADAAAGLVTAILAGLFIGAFGGSSFLISGPTGAMAAILLPLSTRFGVEGVLVAGFLSGIILVLASALSAGRIVSIIPSPVITGFTSGIALIIVFGQVDNLLGVRSQGEHTIQKLLWFAQNSFTVSWQSIMFGLLTVMIMLLWPRRLAQRVPGSLAGLLGALVVNLLGPFSVQEVGTIPRTLLLEHRVTLTYLDLAFIQPLLVPALSIAALGMIETLLCGAAGSTMREDRVDSNQELFAQGLGNIIIPLFGGVPATAAIARTSVGIKAGGRTRLTSVFHAGFLIASMFLLSPVMSRIPLASLAGILIMTAWRMNDWESIRTIFHKRYKTSIAQYLTTLVATVIFDLTIAIVIGIGLSALLFVIRSSYLDITVANIDERHEKGRNLTDTYSEVKLVYVTGPLFFGSQDRLISTIEQIEDAKTIILSIRGVPSIDHSAMMVLQTLYASLERQGKRLIFCGLQSQVKRQFSRSGFDSIVGQESIFDNAVAAIDSLELPV